MKSVTTLLSNDVTRALGNVDLSNTVTSCPGIGSHSVKLAEQFTGLVADLQNGDSTSVIRYINRGCIRADVEAVLGRTLDAHEAVIAGRLAPCHIEDIDLSRACTIARELQAMRASARKTCQMYQAHGIGSKELHRRLTGFIASALDLLEDDFDEA